MTDNGKSPASRLEQDLATAENMIRGAHKALAGGQRLDLAPLGALIAELCTGLAEKAKASPDPGALCRRLESMVSELNRMEELLRIQAKADGLQEPAPGPGTDKEE